MKRFIEGADRVQSTLLPECLDDWIDEDNAVRASDAFVDALEMKELGFERVEPAATGRPAFHPSVLLKLYICGYLNRESFDHVVEDVDISPPLVTAPSKLLKPLAHNDWFTCRYRPEFRCISFQQFCCPPQGLGSDQWITRVGHKRLLFAFESD